MKYTRKDELATKKKKRKEKGKKRKKNKNFPPI